MNLRELTERVEYQVVRGTPDREIKAVVYDSRRAGKDALFVCMAGAAFDSHSCMEEVCEKGAAALIIEEGRSLEGLRIPEETAVLSVKDTRSALALVSAAWFGYPAEQIPVIGITGTKGKTTTTYMIRSILMLPELLMERDFHQEKRH